MLICECLSVRIHWLVRRLELVVFYLIAHVMSFVRRFGLYLVWVAQAGTRLTFVFFILWWGGLAITLDIYLAGSILKEMPVGSPQPTESFHMSALRGSLLSWVVAMWHQWVTLLVVLYGNSSPMGLLRIRVEWFTFQWDSSWRMGRMRASSVPRMLRSYQSYTSYPIGNEIT